MVTMNQLLEDYGRIIDEQKLEIQKFRVALSEIANVVGGAVLPSASVEFLTENVLEEVKLVVSDLKADNDHLRERIKKLCKR